MEVDYLKNPPEEIIVDIGRQLFVDDFLIEKTDLSFSYHNAKKFEGNPIFYPQTKWEKDEAMPCAVPKSGGVWWDKDDKIFKMWYEAGWVHQLAYATSKDGIHWDRPNLDIEKGTNKILVYPDKYKSMQCHNTLENNLFIDCKTPYSYDVRGIGRYLDDVVKQLRQNVVKRYENDAYIKDPIVCNDVIYSIFSDGGLELDMLRGPVFFGAAAKINLLTDFIREIREEITKIGRRKNKKIRMSARVYLNNKKCIEAGYDAAEWGRKGFVDILMLSNLFVPTTYYAPVKEWRCLMENSSCKINIATDFCSYCTKWDEPYTRYLKNNTKTLKGFAANAFYEGAAGIYTFNVMLDGYTKDVDLNLRVNFKEFSSYETAINGIRTHIYTQNEQFDNIIDLPIKSGIVQLFTAKRPENFYRIIIGTDSKDVPVVLLNGYKTEFCGREYNPVKQNPPFIYDVSETAEYVYEYDVNDISIINDGGNEISIESIGNIIWIQADIA